MNKSKRKRKPRYERYELERSPFAQKPTQQGLAALVDHTRDDLRRLANYKEQFIVRRSIEVRGKNRQLVYPENRLRVVHEKLKFHFNKIKCPDYLYSPRKNHSTRQNAELHLGQQQYLTLDLKQFYPSTTKAHIKNWLVSDLGMFDDVAGLFGELVTADNSVFFGSPFTPVLCAHLNRPMFDKIYQLCLDRGLRFSVWVDDLTISGKFVPGKLLEEIRRIISSYEYRSHKIAFKNGNKPVIITGIGVMGKNLIAPQYFHQKMKELWTELQLAVTDDEKLSIYSELLSRLGTQRYIYGRNSYMGCKASDQMNSIRQKKSKIHRTQQERYRIRMAENKNSINIDCADLPWD